MTILVTGGAGYIGSHMVLALTDLRRDVVVLDNLSTSPRPLPVAGAEFVEGEVADGGLIASLIRRHRITAVVHFAAWTVLPDSIAAPLRYYENNVEATRSLLSACIAEGVREFVFSSSAAVYGNAASSMVSEDAPAQPVTPYGRTKLIVEWMLADAFRAHGLRSISLRYFNVAGADPRGRAGQSTPGATHLVKRVCQVALGRLPCLEIYGTDFPTPDGTGVRDFIHVSDLVDAHVRALDSVRADGPLRIYNCGYGEGVSVRQVVREMEAITGRPLPVAERPRREGDLAAVIADPTRLKAELGWKPKHQNLREILQSALDWEARQ